MAIGSSEGPGVARRPGGPAIVGWAAVAILVMEGALLLTFGAGEEGWRALVRASARTSALLFCAAFAASSLAARWPGPATAWLLDNRRYVGLSFAFSHLTHLIAILSLAAVLPLRETRILPVERIAGWIGYLFVAAMAATSFDGAVRWLGPRRWRLLHRTGGYVVLVILFLMFLPVHPPYFGNALFFGLVVATAAVRFGARGARAEA